MMALMADFTDIPKEAIDALPPLRYLGTVDLIEDADAALTAARELAREEVLGFDTETRPSFQRGQNYPVSLLQLAGANKVFLFRVLQFKIPNELLDVLENPAIVKAGVAIRDDIKGLQKLAPFNPAGFIELATLSDKAGIGHNGLRGIAATVLGGKMSKKAKLTNWQTKTLNPEQIVYAATDAWVGREIYLKLKNYQNTDGQK